MALHHHVWEVVIQTLGQLVPNGGWELHTGVAFASAYYISSGRVGTDFHEMLELMENYDSSHPWEICGQPLKVTISKYNESICTHPHSHQINGDCYFLLPPTKFRDVPWCSSELPCLESLMVASNIFQNMTVIGIEIVLASFTEVLLLWRSGQTKITNGHRTLLLPFKSVIFHTISLW